MLIFITYITVKVLSANIPYGPYPVTSPSILCSSLTLRSYNESLISNQTLLSTNISISFSFASIFIVHLNAEQLFYQSLDCDKGPVLRKPANQKAPHCIMLLMLKACLISHSISPILMLRTILTALVSFVI